MLGLVQVMGPTHERDIAQVEFAAIVALVKLKNAAARAWTEAHMPKPPRLITEFHQVCPNEQQWVPIFHDFEFRDAQGNVAAELELHGYLYHSCVRGGFPTGAVKPTQ